MKARIPQHREFIINFPDTVDNAKANKGWAKLQQIEIGRASCRERVYHCV